MRLNSPRSLLRGYLDLYEGNRWVGFFFVPLSLIACVVVVREWASQFGIVVAVVVTTLAAIAWGGASLLVQRETRKVSRAAGRQPLRTAYQQAPPSRRLLIVLMLAVAAVLMVWGLWFGYTESARHLRR